jgi:hypothetical protein
VVAAVGSPQLAEDQLAEAFAKAWVSRRNRQLLLLRPRLLAFTGRDRRGGWAVYRDAAIGCAAHDHDRPDDGIGLLYGGPGPAAS